MSSTLEAMPQAPSEAEPKLTRAEAIFYQSELIPFMLDIKPPNSPTTAQVSEWIARHARDFNEKVLHDEGFTKLYREGKEREALERAEKLLTEFE